jgi:uncharacterized protein (TIGR02145 family)
MKQAQHLLFVFLLVAGISANAKVANNISTVAKTPPVNTWTGTTSNLWSDASNWSAGLPTAASDVDIPAAPSNQPVITNGTTALVHNLTIHTGASLTIDNGGTLNVAPGGVITNSGSFTNNGSFSNCTTPVVVITPSPNTTVLTCSTTSITLTASGGGSYLWDDNSTNASRVVSAAGTYTVMVSGANGCMGSANISITQDNSAPSAAITPSPNTTVLTCSTPNITLTASGGGSYLWDNSSTNASRVVSAAGTYTVTITGANGCTASANVSITGSGNCISTVTICSQQWMDKNLDVSKYRNGDPIPQVTDPAAWAALTTGAWCYNNNDPANEAVYGKLYNWYAVNDPRGLAPEGFHIPTAAEWTTLQTCLGGASVAGGKMKETGTTHWTTPNTGATNSSGFTGLPGSNRDFDGTFLHVGDGGFWWSSTEATPTVALYRALFYSYGGIDLNIYQKTSGFSVRCIFSVAIGDSYQGGIVAYILQPGDPGYITGETHGLIAAAADQSTGAQWGCFGTVIPGADGTALGTGNQNTIDIMAGCATAGIAARICGDLVLNSYSDWYLPSKDELNKLYINQVAIGGFSSNYYWSSSEFDDSYARGQNIGSGLQVNAVKGNAYRIRAVRAF